MAAKSMNADNVMDILGNAPYGTTHVLISEDCINYIKIEGHSVKVFNSLAVWSAPIKDVADVFIENDVIRLEFLENLYRNLIYERRL